MDTKNDENNSVTLMQEIFPGDTNDFGTMFGGNVMAIMDKAAGICAVKFSKGNVVTAGVDRLKFLSPANQGCIVEAVARVVYTSNHTVGLRVVLSTRNKRTWEASHCCTAYFFMVAIGEKGKLRRVPKFIPTTSGELKEFDLVEALHKKIVK